MSIDAVDWKDSDNRALRRRFFGGETDSNILVHVNKQLVECLRVLKNNEIIMKTVFSLKHC